MADPSFELRNSEAIETALKEISKKELMKLLREAGHRIIQEHKVFDQHWREGQSSWSEPSTAYAKFVKKKYGGSGRFEATGAARKALAKKPTRTGPLVLTVSKKHNSLTIHLRKMVNGKNVYAIAQRGRFKGVTTTDGKQVSAEKIREINASNYKEFEGAKQRGSKVSLRQIASRNAKKHGIDKATRASDNPRIITEVMAQDIPAIQASIMAEIEITLKLRGINV